MPMPCGDVAALMLLAVTWGAHATNLTPVDRPRAWYGPRLHVADEAGAAEGQATDPRASDAYRRAVELEARGDADAALALLWTASGIAPRDVEIQTRLAEALQRVGALDAAIDPRWARG